MFVTGQPDATVRPTHGPDGTSGGSTVTTDGIDDGTATDGTTDGPSTTEDPSADGTNGDCSFDSVEISCTSSLEMVMPGACFESIGVDPSMVFVHMHPEEGAAPESCHGTVSDGIIYVSIGLTECGMDVSTNETHILYSNKIRGMSSSTAAHGVIRRDRSIELDFTCSFPLEVTLSLDYAVRPMMSAAEYDLGSYEGVMDIHMAQYERF